MDFDASRPVWLQLVEEFTRCIAVGEWEPGARVPSTRELAISYRVNPNTVQKALSEMDRRGHTRSERASGRYVLAAGRAVERVRDGESVEVVDRAIERLTGLGLTAEQITALVRERLTLGEKEGDHL